MKNLSILGSTGSIGQNTLKIVALFPERFPVKALTAATNVDLLARQIDAFGPELAAVIDEPHAEQLKKKIRPDSEVEIVYGEEGYQKAASLVSVDMVVAAMVGAAGLVPTLAGISAGKDIALANKETLVMAGKMVMDLAKEKNVNILPVDSEHSAIFQSLGSNRKQDMDKIFLTASGGPFLHTPKTEFANITPKEALAHPNWDMGNKISIDSATLMNKGLEVIEAAALFDVTVDQIEVVVHPQSIVHSMVGYKDGSVLAQMGVPDMKGAIAYALSYPERMAIQQPLPNFADIGSLTFEKPDLERFPCLALAFEACRTGHTLPVVLNAVNEIAVQRFLEFALPFEGIARVVQKVMDRHDIRTDPDLAAILEADEWARQQAEVVMTQISC